MNHNVNIIYSSPEGNLQASKTLTGDVNNAANFTVAPGATNAAEPFSITNANLQSVILLFVATGSINGSIGGHATVKTNSSGSPQDTITCTDGVPEMYYVGGQAAALFAGNVTEFYITDVSTGAVGGTLYVRSLSQQ